MSLAAVDTTANFLLACQWASERYQNVCSRIRPRHLRHLGRVNIPAVVEAGTVTIARGAQVVTGDATAQAAWSNVLVGRYFRARTVWYKITQVTSTSTLVLDQLFTEADVSAGSYKIVSRQVPLGANVRWFSDIMVHARHRRPLDNLAMPELDYRFPERQLVGPPPEFWSQTEDVILSSGQRSSAAEFYPYPTLSETIYFIYWDAPPTLKQDDQIPNNIDPYQLKEGVLVDVMRFNASKAANMVPAQIEAAAYWRNEYRAQQTTWEKIVLEIGRQDKGVDDLTFILTLTRNPSGSFYDIQTARDEVYSRGNRP